MKRCTIWLAPLPPRPPPRRFHGGMQAITYEWGSFLHTAQASRSPDDTVLAALSHSMADWAGAYPSRKYPVAT